MFGLGPTEMVIILVVALAIFGPKKLPEVGRAIGRGIGELRSASHDVKEAVDLDLEPEQVNSKKVDETSS